MHFCIFLIFSGKQSNLLFIRIVKTIILFVGNILNLKCINYLLSLIPQNKCNTTFYLLKLNIMTTTYCDCGPNSSTIIKNNVI